ncbi:MFS transporter [Candidatus Protofrankia californiensis]|uniref:MFS transporter n=1 Tax=Candidatus Protofrankia californiensis TaxID=1839754 RepID=UPI0010415F61|nr:MFS transporter [Candidatus Protofrankia californiensis]
MSTFSAPERSASWRATRVAISALFFTFGAGFGDWVVRIPDVQHRLELSQGTLGTALLAASVGALIGVPLVSYLSVYFDAAALTTATAVVSTVSLALPALAINLGLFVAALFLLGIGNGALGVMMNSQGALLERRVNRPIMASFHGVFSIGGLLGSVAAGWAAGTGISASAHLAGVAAVLTLVVLSAARYLIHDKPERTSRVYALADRRTALFGLLAFCGLLCEGAVSDWSAVLMHDVRHVSPGLAGMGYTAFALSMAVLRLCGDFVANRFGPRTTVRLAGATAVTGSTVIVFTSAVWASILGFAILGAGLAVVGPTVISVISRREPQPAVALSVTTTAGYVGFLAGPPAIGYLAQATTLPTALLILVACCLAITVLGQALPHRHPAPQQPCEAPDLDFSPG